MKVVSIVGARPQFIKAAAVSRVLRERHEEVLVHTGQHYDYEMSGVFFDGLDLPAVDVNLNVGSGSHARQTASILAAVEEVLIAHRPDWVLVFGDTNSTLAGALAAAKMCIPIAHVEAGLRSFNRRMPEETNRILSDHVSDLLLCPSETAVRNLAREGITRNVHLTGDVMLDVLHWAVERVHSASLDSLAKLGLRPGQYLLATLHRSENTDDPKRLEGIVSALNALGEPIVLPLHPRTRKAIATHGLRLARQVHVIEPMGYVDMAALTSSSRMVLTDSGGLQKEAYWLGIPCVTLREETEWVETVSVGWNVLVGSDPTAIVSAVRAMNPPAHRPGLYGERPVAARCVELLG